MPASLGPFAAEIVLAAAVAAADLVEFKLFELRLFVELWPLVVRRPDLGPPPLLLFEEWL